MDNYFVGEYGYNEDSSYKSMVAAIVGAGQLSKERNGTPIAIWDEDDTVIGFALDGALFELVEPE